MPPGGEPAEGVAPVTVGPEYIETDEYVEFRAYHRDTNVYEIYILRGESSEPTGPFFSTPERVAEAVRTVNLRAIRVEPGSLLNEENRRVYTTGPMVVLSAEEVEARRTLGR